MLYVLECTNECSSHTTISLHVNINIYYTIPRPMKHKHTPFPQSLFLPFFPALIIHTVVVVVVVITTVVATTVVLTTTDIVTVVLVTTFVVTTVFLTTTTAVTAFVTTIIITAAVILVIVMVITIITSASLTAICHSSVIMSFVE